MERWLESFARTNFLRSGDTAHDLKTPLNVAVLNLELLRMRLRKLSESDDEKITHYAASIELELRRMASIFDAFFLLSTPPKGEGSPQVVDAGAICAQAAGTAGFGMKSPSMSVLAHESRIRQAFKMFFEGAASLLKPEGRIASAVTDGTGLQVCVTGIPEGADFELTKIFKFYYTDALGNPDLSLATARLIVETYGGQLNATQESGNVTLRLSLPPGEE